MSNDYMKKREAHLAFRKRWIYVISSLIAIFTIMAFVCLYGHKVNSQAIYIEYRENSDVDYKVYLKENDFYEEEYIGKDQSYIASLIDKVVANFDYEIKMDADNVDYKYSYSVDAQLEVFDNEFDKPVYNPVDVLVKEKTYEHKSSEKLSISEQIEIDYEQYNKKAEDFVKAYELTAVDCSLIVKMHISIISKCDDLSAANRNNYTVSLTIPLSHKTTEVKLVSSIPTAENKLLACNNAASNSLTFKATAIAMFILDVLSVIALVVFLAITKDENVDYASKVNKLLRNYRSYIQQINNQFDVTGYQILLVNTFNEMLDIRDTIQRPILFNENDDKTCAKFFIMTDNKVLYLYQIEVSLSDAEESMDESDLLKAYEGKLVSINHLDDEEIESDRLYLIKEELRQAGINLDPNASEEEKAYKQVKIRVKRNRKRR